VQKLLLALPFMVCLLRFCVFSHFAGSDVFVGTLQGVVYMWHYAEGFAGEVVL